MDFDDSNSSPGISPDSDTDDIENDYENSKSGPTLAKEAGLSDKNKCAYQMKINV